MLRLSFAFLAGLASFVLPGAASAALLSQTLDVSAQAGPWSPSLNPGLPYGTGDQGPPAHTTASFDFSAGSAFSITYLSSLATPLSYGAPVFDGRGDTDYVATGQLGTSGRPFPSQYIPATSGTVYLGTLVGAFALDGIVVGSPFAVGNGTSVTSPGGVDEILLGYNDDIFGDNRGSLRVRITGTTAAISPVPLPGAAPLFGLALLGLGAVGAAKRKSAATRT